MSHAAKLAGLAASIALLFTGCAHVKPDGMVTIQGELTSGAECSMIVTRENHRYSLTGSIAPYKVGDRVCIRGKSVEVSFCMAGEGTISIEAIGPEDNCP